MNTKQPGKGIKRWAILRCTIVRVERVLNPGGTGNVGQICIPGMLLMFGGSKRLSKFIVGLFIIRKNRFPLSTTITKHFQHKRTFF